MASDPPPSTTANVHAAYLQLYNGVSALLWFVVLARTILIVPLAGPSNVYGGVGLWTRNTQTLALLEVLHSALGLVRSPLLTTILQVQSRVTIVWVVCERYPEVATSPAYASMLLAWSATEVVRYTYFVFALRGGGVPGVLQYLRYNLFYVLYPVGISSEWWLVLKAVGPASKEDPRFGYLAMFVLAAYVPGSYIMYTHMMRQRQRNMRGKRKAR